MDHDHIKRFNLNERQPHREFRPAAADAPTIKTKDNAQLTPPPPRAVFIPHPTLAPPGMMGSRLGTWSREQKEMLAEAKGERVEKRPAEPAKSRFKLGPKPTRDYEKVGENSFKSIVRNPSKSRGWER